MKAPTDLTSQALAKYIDHTLLRPDATDTDLRQVCDQAREFGFYTVCVYWHQVGRVAGWLAGSGVLPIAVVGFPSGTVPTSEKVQETRTAIAAGAREIDMVINRDWLRSQPQAARDDIRAVVEAAAGAPVKVILENSELSNVEIVLA
ncbi:deoxyribose-phosphate aldolase, partial [bacterium]|nr:deoxyribose-phosphate aldolase [bacterium]